MLLPACTVSPLPAARAARDLAHELEGPLGGAQIRSLQAKVGVDHPDQRQQGKIVPLGNQLRADDDVGSSLRNKTKTKY